MAAPVPRPFVSPPLPLTDLVASVAPDQPQTHPCARIPTEIWREIFIHATCVPRGYDSSYISPFDFSEITDGYTAFLTRLSENHYVKRNLCGVSKRWRAIAQELIFEYLFLQDNYNWHRLADALEESIESEQAHRGHGAGWYVKRMEICTFAWTPELGLAAARVIRCCPNLRVLTVGAIEESEGLPESVVAAVFETCPRALRSIEWTCDLGAQTEMMFQHLPQCRDLRSLFMCVQREIVWSGSEKALMKVELPRVHTIEVVSVDFDPSCVLRVMAHWLLPALRQVVLCGQSDLEENSTFFEAHGSNIRTLEFDYIGENSSKVLKLCANLTGLVVHIHWASIQISEGHPKVERLGLRGLHLVDRGASEQVIVIQSLKSSFPLFLDRKRYPALKLVRLLDFDKTKFKSKKWHAGDIAFWAFWVERFERMNVRLEDHAGDLILIVLSEMKVLLPEDSLPPRAVEGNDTRPREIEGVDDDSHFQYR